MQTNLFTLSAVLTAIAFLVIGALKALVTKTNWFKSIAETLLLGATAASLAYLTGLLLEKILL